MRRECLNSKKYFKDFSDVVVKISQTDFLFLSSY